MADVIIQDTTLSAIGDKVRAICGDTEKLSTSVMQDRLASASTEINTQSDLISQIATALVGKAIGNTGATINITIFGDASNLSWFNANGSMIQGEPDFDGTIDALGGFVFSGGDTSLVRTMSGDYIEAYSTYDEYLENNIRPAMFCFLSDGGSIGITLDEGDV